MDPSTRAPRRERLPRALIAVLAGLGLAAFLSGTVFAPSKRGDLPFFLDAYRAMVGASGLEVYADIPNIQSGPIALLGVGLLDSLGARAFPVAVSVMYLVTIVAIARLEGVPKRHPATLAVGGLVLLFWWRTFTFQGHLDDATVIALSSVALLAIGRERRVAAALLLGVCLAIKPWAVFLLPMTLLAEGPWRRRLVPPMISVVVGGLAWAPFLLSSTGTLDGVRPTVWSAPDSVLRLLSGSAAPMPTVVRITQLVVCLLAVAWVTWRGHVAAALFLGVALRIFFDGGTWSYYTAGLVAGALVVDLVYHRHLMPWLVVAVSVLLPKSTWIDVPELRALLRAVACLAACSVVAWIVRRPGGPEVPSTPDVAGAVTSTSTVKTTVTSTAATRATSSEFV